MLGALPHTFTLLFFFFGIMPSWLRGSGKSWCQRWFIFAGVSAFSIDRCVIREPPGGLRKQPYLHQAVLLEPLLLLFSCQ